MWCCKRTSLALVFALLLGGCGFQPLYGAGNGGTRNVAVQAMAETRIALIPDRAGQELRNHLLDKLTPLGQPAQPRYELQVSLAENIARLGIALDDSATYGRLTMTARFTLREIATGQAVVAGQSRWSNGFTRVPSHFANLVSETDARSRALREIGDDIRLQLGLHFAG